MKFSKKNKEELIEEEGDGDGVDLDVAFIDFLNQYRDPATASEIVFDFLKKNNLQPDDFLDNRKMKRLNTQDLYSRLDALI